MLNADSLIINTRMSDLDSQRHINNASYLNYISEAQFALLKSSGFDFQYLLDNEVRLRPEYVYVKFHRQQLPCIPLRIETRATKTGPGIFWLQDIINADNNDLACSFQSFSRINHAGLLASLSGENNELQRYPLPDFEGRCKRSRLDYEIRHIDLNAFNECSDAVLWRLNEEGRWNFFREAGIPFEDLVKKDISLFWIEGAYRYENNVNLGDSIEVFTWVNRYDRVRIYLNHEIFSGGKRVLIAEGEFIAVSLSKSRAVRVPDYLVEAIIPYADRAVLP